MQDALWILGILSGLLALTKLATDALEAGLRLRLGRGWSNLHPDVRRRALAVLADAKEEFKADRLTVDVYSGWREHDEQQRYIDAGTSFLAAPSGSFHTWGLAVDFVFRDHAGRWSWLPDPARPDNRAYWDARWDRLGAIIEKHGFEWGGKWRQRDGPHAQLPLGGFVRPSLLAANYDGFEAFKETWQA